MDYSSRIQFLIRVNMNAVGIQLHFLVLSLCLLRPRIHGVDNSGEMPNGASIYVTGLVLTWPQHDTDLYIAGEFHHEECIKKVLYIYDFKIQLYFQQSLAFEKFISEKIPALCHLQLSAGNFSEINFLNAKLCWK